jgi:hypothetical protein
MAKKKAAKATKTKDICGKDYCHCRGILAALIIVLIWVNPIATWSRVISTIAAALILLGSGSCMCKKKK